MVTGGSGTLHADLRAESGTGYGFYPGRQYRIHIRAVNTRGPGLPSVPAEVSLEAGPPGMPFNLGAVPRRDGGFELSFDYPPDNGSRITGWEYTTDDGASWQQLDIAAQDRQHLTAVVLFQSPGDGTTPLAPDAQYEIRIHARNALGVGQDTEQISVSRPAPGSPAAPPEMSATPDGDGFDLSFTAPDPGDSAILDYEYSTDNGTNWAGLTVTGDGPLHAKIVEESIADYPVFPGNPYRIRVRAVNTQGAGWPSAAAEAMLPPTAPGAPYVEAEQGLQAITVTMRTSDNGSRITGYDYSTDDGVTWQPLSPVVEDDGYTTATIRNASTGDGSSGLASGQVYRVRVRAANDRGTGAASEPFSVSLPAPGSPGRPTELTASPSGDGISLDFTAPEEGDSTITGYQYSTDDGSTWADAVGDGGSPVAFSVESDSALPLGAGNIYRIRLRAVNTQGPGLHSERVDVSRPPAQPGKPFAITAVPGSRTATVTLGLNDNGSEISKVEYSTDDGVTWREPAEVTPVDKMTGRFTITTGSGGDGTEPLLNGVTYQLRLRATNDLGTSEASDAVGVTPMGTAPAAPGKLTPEGADKKITVGFTVPDDGGSPITGVRYSTDGGDTWADAEPTGTDPFAVTITTRSTGEPLVNGTAYPVRLLLVNSSGEGTPTAAVSVTPLTVPEAPAGFQAVPGDATGSLTFTVPADGGGALTGFEYTTDGGDTWAKLTGVPDDGTLRSTITTGSGETRPKLLNGTTYVVMVRASNAAGAGAATAAVTLTPRTTAGAPVSFAVAARDRAGALTFRPPADNGGSTVTGYEASTDDGTHWNKLSVSGTTELTATIGGLTNDQAYPVRVRAVTAAGPGAPTAAVSLTPLAPPAAPANILTTARTSSISVTWNPPAPGGAPITGYTATAAPGSATCDSSTSTTCVLGAELDKPYTITVVAHSASGDSPASTPAGPVTAIAPVIPAQPPVTDAVLESPTDQDDTTAPGATLTIRGTGYAPNSEVALVVYSAPISLGTVLTDDNGEFSVDVVVPPTLIGDHSIAAMGADPDGGPRAMRLDVTVAEPAPTTPAPTTPARTNPGPSTPAPTTPAPTIPAPTTPAPTTPAPTAPAPTTPAPTTAGAPVSFAVAARNHAGALTFRPPTDNGGSTVTGYEASTDDGTHWNKLPVNGTTELTATISGLTNDQAYPVRVRAVTAAGPGAATAAVSLTPLAPPTAPANILTTARTSSISVTWNPPAPGGAPITGYTATATPGSATCDSSTSTTCVLGAELNKPYTITVVAHSASGDSPASTPSEPVTAVAPVIPAQPPVTDAVLESPTDQDDTTAPGATLTIRGTGYAPNSEVALVVYSAPVSLGTVVTDIFGEFSTEVVVPATLAGEHTIAAIGADPRGNPRAMRLDITVAADNPAVPTPAPTSPDLALTGAAAAGTASLGLLMVFSGAIMVGAVRFGRRREERR